MERVISAEMLLQYMSYLLTGIGVLAFLVSVIVQRFSSKVNKRKHKYT